MSRAVVLLAVLLVFGSATIPLSATAETNEPRDPPIVKIGLLMPQTGALSSYAPGFEVAAQKAIDDLNAAGGNFELFHTDSQCTGTGGGWAAQDSVDAGVVGVAGPLCADAIVTANAVLRAAGIPQISYSTQLSRDLISPDITDFWQVGISMAIGGNALSYFVNESGVSNPALLYRDDNWLGPTKRGFTTAHGENSNGYNLCPELDWDGTPTGFGVSIGHDSNSDFASQVQQVMDNNCDSVVLISNNADGAAIVEEFASQNFSGQIFTASTDPQLFGAIQRGIDEEMCSELVDLNLCDGIVNTKIGSANITSASIAFGSWCSNNTTCASGIYTAEAYDAVRLIGESYLHSQNTSLPLAVSIFFTGNQWGGASEEITFRANGDAVGPPWDVCEFSHSSNQISLNCNETWYGNGPAPGYIDSDGDGYPYSFDSCPNDPNEWLDTDGDGICNNADTDDDNDLVLDVDDAFPLDPYETTDTDGDGVGDNADLNDDGDAWTDAEESACGSDGMDADSVPDDFDGDGICDVIDNDDDDDGVGDLEDGFPFDSNEWLDTDGDGIGNNADTDDDNDGYSDVDETTNCGTPSYYSLDYTAVPTDYDEDGFCDWVDSDDDNDLISDHPAEDACPKGFLNWTSNNETDHDSDGCHDDNEDSDDDNDRVMDGIDSCPLGQTNWASNPTSDYDGDGCRDYDEDIDDDNDGINDEDDAFPLDPCVSSDHDSDGLSDLLHYVEDCQTSVLLDLDHDNDLVLDTDDFCWYGDLNWTSGAVLGTDHDGDGCRDDGEDTDDDGDGVDDSEDQCPRGHTGWLSNPVNDIDGDGCHETEDYDRDGDGFNDVEDAFPEDSEEWSDSDGDGVGDNGDAYPNDPSRWEIGDDDGDGDPDGGDFTILLLVGTIICLIIALVVVLKRK